MYIKKVQGWSNVGHLESDVYVPYNTEVPEEYPPLWYVTDVHPSPDRLFNAFTIPKDPQSGRTYENFRNTKYLRLEYDELDYPIFGWVEGVNVITTRHTAIIWHVDYWRTYFRKVKYKGWVKLRAPSPAGNTRDPYHDIPAFNQKATLEDIPIDNQKRGIAWVIITYVEGDALIAAAARAVGNSIFPILNVNDGVRDIGAGMFNFFSVPAYNMVNRYIEGLAPNSDSRNQIVAGSQNNYAVYRDNDVVRCLITPISLNADERIHFSCPSIESVRAVYQPITAVLYGPTLREVVNGSFGRQLGIKDNQLINCVVSPVCPLPMETSRYNVGLSPETAIRLKLKSDDLLSQPFWSENWRILSTDTSENRAFLKIKNFGIKDVGSISAGCPKLGPLLSKYYFGYYDIGPFVYKSEVTREIYTVNIEKPLIHSDDNRMLVRLEVYLDLLCPLWRTYGSLDVTSLVRRVEGRYTSDIYRVVFDGEPPADKLWEPHTHGSTVTWIHRPPTKVWEMCNWLRTKGENDALSIIDTQYETVRIKARSDDDKQVDVCKIEELYIALTVPQETPTWSEPIEYNKRIAVNQFSYASSMRVGWFHSAQDWTYVAGIYTRSLFFGKVKGELPREYHTDDYNELYLVGPNGDIIHKFRTGVRVKGYTYQLVNDQAPYLKLKFDLEHGQTRYAMVADSEVHVPLTKMIAFSSYHNPWTYISEASQTYMKNRFENQQQARAKNLEWANILLERKKETSGLTTNAFMQLKDIGNKAWDVGKGVFGTLADFFAGKFVNKTTDPPNPVYGQRESAAEEFKEGMKNVGTAFVTPKTFWDPEKKLFEAKWRQERLERDFRHKIGGFNIETVTNSMLSIGDCSWLTEYGSLRLVHVTKDDYSINRYHNTANVIGIEVNEHIATFRELMPGPIKLEPCILKGEGVPKDGIDYIRTRLEGGVYIDRHL